MGKQKLKLTDQDFFKRIVRLEFKKYMRVYSPEEIAFQKKVCKLIISTLLTTFAMSLKSNYIVLLSS